MSFQKQKSLRWCYLILSVGILLCLGLIYAWSVFRVPLEQEFGWSKAETSITFSISMMMFCLGGVVSGFLTARKGIKITLIACALCLGAGFSLASQISSLGGLYATYGILCGFGVGLGYNCVISTIVRWFPDKMGLVSGISLMGFGLGAMLLGTIAASLISVIGWRMTFLVIAAVFCGVVFIGVWRLRTVPLEFLQTLNSHINKKKQAVEELSTMQMVCRRNFWLYFAWAASLSAAGLAVINISTGYAIEFVSGDLAEAAAVAGIVSIANGVGRVVFGQLFDSKGYRMTMVVITVLSMLAGLVFVVADMTKNIQFLVIAFAAIGLMYGGVTPTNSAYTAYFFGHKQYALNFSVTNLNLIVASYAGPLCASGEPMTAFYIMIGLSIFAVFFILGIRKPHTIDYERNCTDERNIEFD